MSFQFKKLFIYEQPTEAVTFHISIERLMQVCGFYLKDSKFK